MSGHNGDRPPSRAGRITADSGVGTTTREGLARIGRGSAKASPELKGVGVPCAAGRDRERGRRDGMHVSKPRGSEALNRDDGV